MLANTLLQTQHDELIMFQFSVSTNQQLVSNPSAQFFPPRIHPIQQELTEALQRKERECSQFIAQIKKLQDANEHLHRKNEMVKRRSQKGPRRPVSIESRDTIYFVVNVEMEHWFNPIHIGYWNTGVANPYMKLKG